ncbi:TIR domain-containing protein [Candidatus Gracilibacteria bacterium]|nr:TIR domain-containing protein [Candidatus Gracilibacteria bacterium]
MSSPQVLLRVMLACAPDDVIAMRDLARRLRQERMQPWLLNDDAPAGVPIERALRATLPTSDVVLCCISPAPLKPHDALAETFGVLATLEPQPRRLVIGVKLQDCSTPAALEKVPAIDLFAPRGYERLMRTLWAHIASLRKTSRSPQPAPRTKSAEPTEPHGRIALPLLQTQHQIERFGRGVAHRVWMLDRRFALLSGGGGALLADLIQGEVRWEIDAPTRSASFDQRRRWLALGATGRFSIWDVHALRLLNEGESDAGPLTALAFHPIEPMLLSASSDGAMTLWRMADRNTMQALASFRAHQAAVTSLAFSPDGRYFASAATDRSIRLWRTLDRSVSQEFDDSSVVEQLTFTPDSQQLVAAARNRSVRVFSCADGRLLHTIAEPHTSAVEALALTSSGELGASGTSNGTFALWDVRSGQVQARLQSAAKGVSALSFAPTVQNWLCGTTTSASRSGRGHVGLHIPILCCTTPLCSRQVSARTGGSWRSACAMTAARSGHSAATRARLSALRTRAHRWSACISPSKTLCCSASPPPASCGAICYARAAAPWPALSAVRRGW